MEAASEITTESDQDDLESTFRTHYAAIARMIARIVRDPGCAEELAVDVFLKWNAAGRKGAPGALYCAAARLGLDELRRRSRRERLNRLVEFFRPPRTPEEIRDADDRHDRVGAVLAAMKDRDAGLLVLRAEGLGYTEIAERLSMNPASVGTLLSRAQLNFRKEYFKRYGTNE